MLSSTEPVAADEPLCRGAAAFRKVHPLQFHRAFLSEGVRSDGRGLLRARRASVQIGVISTADASAMVHIGETTVLAVVKAHPTLPSETEPGLGRIAVALELAPTCTSMSSSMARGGAVQRRLERQQVTLSSSNALRLAPNLIESNIYACAGCAVRVAAAHRIQRIDRSREPMHRGRTSSMGVPLRSSCTRA